MHKIKVKPSILFSLILFFTFGCNLNSSKTWKNESIEESIKDDIHNLNQQIVTAFHQNEPEVIFSKTGQALKNQTSKEELANIVGQLSQALLNDKLMIIDEYYTANSTEQANNFLIGDDYKLSYIAANEEMFASLLEVNVQPQSNLIIGLIYGKYGEEWKLNICQIGEYKFHQMSAINFYKKAQKQYEKRHLVGAANSLFLAQRLLNPLKNMWVYNEKKEIVSMFERVRNEANETYKFPLVLEKINSKPQLLSISPQILNEGIIPLIDYQTNINLKDTIALKEEYLKISDFVKTDFKGMAEENKLFLFKAFTQIPDGKTAVDTYTFIHRAD